MFYAPAPSASELANWQNQRRTLADTYGYNQANYNYNKGNTQSNYAISTDRLGRDFNAMRQKLPESFAHRGLLGSGIEQRGVNQLAQNQSDQTLDTARAYQQAMGQLDLNQWGGTQAYATGTSGVDAAEAARRADLAAAIQGLV